MTRSVRPSLYVPILKGKRAELDALGAVSEPTSSSLYPMLEIVPSEGGNPEADVDRLLEQLATRWAFEPVMLDLGHFDLSIDDGRRTLLGYAMEHADNYVKHPVPVVRLSDPDLALQDAATAGDGALGASVRLSAEDLDVDPDELNDSLDLVLRKLGLDRTEVDLVLDLGAISSDVAVVGGARLVVAILRELDGINDFRTVTVASGAFPPGLSDLSAWTLGEYLRDDAALYNRVRRRPHDREISFGDYAIAHPLLSTNAPFSPAPQLRYTVADRWLTLKGRKNDPRGNSQFFDVCATIAAHPAFVGPDLGAADRRIFEGVKGGHGPGNATTWRQLGIQHHLDLVVARLTTLGEP